MQSKHLSCMSLGAFYLSSFLAKDVKGVFVVSAHLGESTLRFWLPDLSAMLCKATIPPTSAGLLGERLVLVIFVLF